MQAVNYTLPTVREMTSVQKNIRDAFRQSGYHELRDVSVCVFGEGVRIEGNVRTYYLKQVAQTVAMSVHGVERIDNLLTVE